MRVGRSLLEGHDFERFLEEVSEIQAVISMRRCRTRMRFGLMSHLRCNEIEPESLVLPFINGLDLWVEGG
jgi:hypothetical protein